MVAFNNDEIRALRDVKIPLKEIDTDWQILLQQLTQLSQKEPASSYSYDYKLYGILSSISKIIQTCNDLTRDPAHTFLSILFSIELFTRLSFILTKIKDEVTYNPINVVLYNALVQKLQSDDVTSFQPRPAVDSEVSQKTCELRTDLRAYFPDLSSAERHLSTLLKKLSQSSDEQGNSVERQKYLRSIKKLLEYINCRADLLYWAHEINEDARQQVALFVSTINAQLTNEQLSPDFCGEKLVALSATEPTQQRLNRLNELMQKNNLSLDDIRTTERLKEQLKAEYNSLVVQVQAMDCLQHLHFDDQIRLAQEILIALKQFDFFINKPQECSVDHNDILETITLLQNFAKLRLPGTSDLLQSLQNLLATFCNRTLAASESLLLSHINGTSKKIIEIIEQSGDIRPTVQLLVKYFCDFKTLGTATLNALDDFLILISNQFGELFPNIVDSVTYAQLLKLRVSAFKVSVSQKIHGLKLIENLETDYKRLTKGLDQQTDSQYFSHLRSWANTLRNLEVLHVTSSDAIVFNLKAAKAAEAEAAEAAKAAEAAEAEAAKVAKELLKDIEKLFTKNSVSYASIENFIYMNLPTVATKCELFEESIKDESLIDSCEYLKLINKELNALIQSTSNSQVQIQDLRMSTRIENIGKILLTSRLLSIETHKNDTKLIEEFITASVSVLDAQKPIEAKGTINEPDANNYFYKFLIKTGIWTILKQQNLMTLLSNDRQRELLYQELIVGFQELLSQLGSLPQDNIETTALTAYCAQIKEKLLSSPNDEVPNAKVLKAYEKIFTNVVQFCSLLQSQENSNVDPGSSTSNLPKKPPEEEKSEIINRFVKYSPKIGLVPGKSKTFKKVCYCLAVLMVAAAVTSAAVFSGGALLIIGVGVASAIFLLLTPKTSDALARFFFKKEKAVFAVEDSLSDLKHAKSFTEDDKLLWKY